jgi:hypothetical protein
MLSTACFLQAVVGGKPAEALPLFRGMVWHREILVFAALFAYAQLIPFWGNNIRRIYRINGH